MRVPPATLKPTRTALAVALACFALSACVSIGDRSRTESGPAAVAGPTGEKTADGSELWLIPSTIPGHLMRSTLALPRGPGPFPLAVIAHGSEQDPSRRVGAPMPSFPALTSWFLSKNYAVLVPQRPGHGATGGRYLEDQGPCNAADYIGAGNGAADSIASAITYMTGQPNIRANGVVVAGNSAGGWGAIALAARNPPNVRAVIAFSAGRGGRDRGQANTNCSAERLVTAAGVFGRTARTPTLWLYSENDTYFPRALSSEMAAAFRQSGGNITYRLLPPVRTGEGHTLIDVAGPPPPWAADLERFLSGAR